jgi:hypothetical protein
MVILSFGWRGVAPQIFYPSCAYARQPHYRCSRTSRTGTDDEWCRELTEHF